MRIANTIEKWVQIFSRFQRPGDLTHFINHVFDSAIGDPRSIT